MPMPVIGRCGEAAPVPFAGSFRQAARSGHVDDLELEPVGVVEEDRVVPGMVLVLLGPALDLGAAGAQPVRALVDDFARRRLERDVVDADRVAVVARRGVCASRSPIGARPAEVPDRLAALALDLGDPVPAQRPEQLAVERQAALDRRDDEVDVMDAGGRTNLSVRRQRRSPPRARSDGAVARRAGRARAPAAAAAARPPAPASGRARRARRA